MRPLLKADDGKKSITVTGLAITFGFLIMCMVLVLMGRFDASAIGWFQLPFTIFAGLYWNKKIIASKDGIEIK